MTAEVVQGDCRQVMAEMEPESIEAIVTDPPYELAFMSKSWDAAGVAFEAETWKACLRVLKPGGHLLAFGGTRTSHRMVCAIEDAGFEIRDTLMYLYGSGFPKSLDVSKAIDKAAGAERQIVAEGAPVKRMIPGADQNATGSWLKDNGRVFVPTETQPATDDAATWEGWGTALKPAYEPIVVARKPLIGTVAANVLTHGTGALNIDASRIPTTDSLGGGAEDNPPPKGEGWDRPWRHDPDAVAAHSERIRANVRHAESLGRWPANVVLDEDAARLLDEQSGTSTSRIGNPRGAAAGNGWGMTATGSEYADSGGASRFFYTAKLDPDEHVSDNEAWESTGQSHGIQAESGTSPQRGITDSPSGALKPKVPGQSSGMSGSGSRPTDPYQTDINSTTSTETSRTTDSKTSDLSTPLPISDCTAGVNCETASGGNPAPSAVNSSQSTATTGTSPERDGRSMAGAGRAILPESLPINRGDVPRFKYAAKASSAERTLPDGTRSNHPTVKPLSLMRWLVRLVTPPGGVVLDPFAGSGSTLVAALNEGFNAIGIEQDEGYIELINQRISGVTLPLPLEEGA